MILFDKVSKKFPLHYQNRSRSFQEVMVNLFRNSRSYQEYVWILQKVSFQIEQGQTVGVIGRNGAGKSTLLKLISQIIWPDTGIIKVQGRVSSLLELGAGFHPDLTGRENVFLYGAILGLKREKIRQKFDEIVEFAGLESFIDIPVKHYSSGMYLRLAFSTAIFVEPDILLIDEAFAVGDHFFQQRCLNQIAALIEAGVTVILVSHDMGVVRQYCDRAIWFDEGVIKADGEVEWVIETYLEHLYAANLKSDYQVTLPRRLASAEEIETARQNGENVNRWGSGEVEIVDVEFINESGANQQAFLTGQTMTARIHYQAFQSIKNPVFGVAIYRVDGLHVNGPNTQLANYTIPLIEGTGYIEYVIDNLNLLPGTYDFSTVVYDETATQAYDHQHRLYNFMVRAGKVREQYGVFYLPSRWAHYPQKTSDTSAPLSGENYSRLTLEKSNGLI